MERQSLFGKLDSLWLNTFAISALQALNQSGFLYGFHLNIHYKVTWLSFAGAKFALPDCQPRSRTTPHLAHCENGFLFQVVAVQSQLEIVHHGRRDSSTSLDCEATHLTEHWWLWTCTEMYLSWKKKWNFNFYGENNDFQQKFLEDSIESMSSFSSNKHISVSTGPPVMIRHFILSSSMSIIRLQHVSLHTIQCVLFLTTPFFFISPLNYRSIFATWLFGISPLVWTFKNIEEK